MSAYLRAVRDTIARECGKDPASVTDQDISGALADPLVRHAVEGLIERHNRLMERNNAAAAAQRDLEMEQRGAYLTALTASLSNR